MKETRKEFKRKRGRFIVFCEFYDLGSMIDPNSKINEKPTQTVLHKLKSSENSSLGLSFT